MNELAGPNERSAAQPVLKDVLTLDPPLAQKPLEFPRKQIARGQVLWADLGLAVLDGALLQTVDERLDVGI